MHPFMHTQNFLLNVKHTCTISVSISVLAKFVLQVSGIGSIGKNWYRYTSNYKTIVKLHYFKKKPTQDFQQPYSYNIRANLKNLGIVSFHRAQGIRKCFYRLHILIFSFERCVCLCMVNVIAANCMIKQ